jgi:hypothetical protein
MILGTGKLSSSRKAALEELADRDLRDREKITFCGGTLKIATAEERQTAAALMRHQLYLLDKSQRRMSIEDFAAALLENSAAEIPV